MRKSLVVIILCYWILGFEVDARPQYSMLTGNRCLNCHVNVQGGGPRNLLGSYTRDGLSLISSESIGIGEFEKVLTENRSAFDETLIYGFDYRLQSAKFRSQDGFTRKIFSMQATPYIVYYPVNWLTVQAQYNFVKPEYKSQKAWSASVVIQPDYSMPQLRIGFFQPSFGIRYDDHTVFTRQIVGQIRPTPVIPPDYAEIGAEVNYDGIKWLNIGAGIFSAKSLAEQTIINASGQNESIVSEKSLLKLLRLSFFPRFFQNEINLNFGGSYLFVDDFRLTGLFLNAGLTDDLSLLTEYVTSDKNNLRVTKNYVVDLTYNLINPLHLSVRYEKGVFEQKLDNNTFNTNSIVLGAIINLLPFVNIRPEYRIYDRESFPGHDAQWAVQLHLFY